MATYVGFSTQGRSKKFTVTDFELAKQDLQNHLQIRKGEKLNNPEFGTIVWNLLFEPLTPEVRAAINKDLSDVISYDPRLATENIVVTQYEYGIQVQIDLIYVPTNQTSTLIVNFDKQTSF